MNTRKTSLENSRMLLEGEDLWWVVGAERDRVGNLVRCFPATSPNHWISVRSEEGVELALIQSLEDLDPESRATVEPVLLEKYHVPAISQILSVEGSPSERLIRVQTDDGIVSLDVNVEADVDFRDYPRVSINDRTKRRKYVIEDADALDKQSRDLIRKYLRRSRGRRGRGFR
jgi:hypothetical protein